MVTLKSLMKSSARKNRQRTPVEVLDPSPKKKSREGEHIFKNVV